MVRMTRGRPLVLLACLLALCVALPVLASTLAYVVPELRARQGGVAQAPFDGPVPAPAYAQGWWQRYENEADGYVLALPPDWQVRPLDAGTDGGPLAGWARARSAEGQGLWLAVAPEGEDAATTVNIIRQPLAAEMSVDDFARANVQALLEAGGASVLGRDWLSIGEGRALRLRMTYQPPAAEGRGSLAMTQAYLVHGSDGYVITITTSPEQAEGYVPVFDGIVRSLRWLA